MNIVQQLFFLLTIFSIFFLIVNNIFDILVIEKSQRILKYIVITRLIRILTHEILVILHYIRDKISQKKNPSRVFFAYTNVKPSFGIPIL